MGIYHHPGRWGCPPCQAGFSVPEENGQEGGKGSTLLVITQRAGRAPTGHLPPGGHGRDNDSIQHAASRGLSKLSGGDWGMIVL